MYRTPIPLILLLAACGSSEVVEPVATAPTPPAEPASVSIYEDTDLPVIEEAPDPFTLAVAEVEPEPIEAATPPEHTVDIEVRPGESLVLLASWSGVPAEDIAALNDIHVTGTVFPGQGLVLPLDLQEAASFGDLRGEFHDARLQRFVDGRGGLVKVEAHAVGTGETAWGISRSGDMPLWVLSWFNQDKNLDRLSIGDELFIPVLGNTLARPTPEAESAVVDAHDPEAGAVADPDQDMVATAEE